MKISEMTTAQATDALVRISEPAEAILRDEKLNDAFTKIQQNAKDNSGNFSTIADIVSMIPSLLRYHRAETFEIISALSGKTVAEIEAQNIKQTIQDVKESVDQDLIDFFH